LPRPFEVNPDYLREHLDELVRATIADLTSEFLVLPKGNGFIEYQAFRDAYEVLKRWTRAFVAVDEGTVGQAIRENSRVFGVLRAVLGMTPPEWAALARSELGKDVSQGAARTLDRACRKDPGYVRRVERRYAERVGRDKGQGAPVPRPKSLDCVDGLVAVAVQIVARGATASEGFIHRLDKFDTAEGFASLRHAAGEGVPYAVLLYERYLGRPFAGHRDAISGLIGDEMESAIENRLRDAGITYRKTRRAERIPGFGQAPDFCVPDEISPVAVIEAKITSDDGTARDKVTRIKNLVTQRDQHVADGRNRYEVVACIDGRGFRERREDMRQLLLALDGKVFTAATLDQLILHTRLGKFVSI
jgi:hypothetical protein